MRVLDLNSRTCPICRNGVEDEKHEILQCSLYDDIRQHLSDKAANENESFIRLNDTDKLVFLFKNDQTMCQNLFSDFT